MSAAPTGRARGAAPFSIRRAAATSFFPPREDAELADELASLAPQSFRTTAFVLLGTVAWLLVLEAVTGTPTAGRPWGHAAMAVMGVGMYAAAAADWTKRHARAIAVALGLLLALIYTLSVMIRLPANPHEDHHLPGSLSLVMLAVVAIFPLRPAHVLLLGVSTTLLHAGLASAGPRWLGIGAEAAPGHAMSTGLGALVALGVGALIYGQRRRAFYARQSAQQALTSLQEAQSRLLVSRAAMSQGRLAAALAHELNTPLGVVNSALGSLSASYDREAPAEGARAEAMRQLIAGANDASARLREVVERMKRFTHLDRSETGPCDVNVLITDTVDVLLSESEGRGCTPELDLGELPPIWGQARALSAVLTTLIRNASEAAGRDGQVAIVSRLDAQGGLIHVEIRDDGPGISAERLADLFEPSFAVKNGRVVTSNWGLASSRRIVAEHHGRLELESTEGRGAVARLELPVTVA